MKVALSFLKLFASIFLGAVVLPFLMFATFRVFTSFGGDIAQLLHRFESPNGTPELWAKVFYAVMGGPLGGLSAFVFFQRRKVVLGESLAFCALVVGLGLFPIGVAWKQIATDGYNTFIGALVLLLIPTIWVIGLLVWSVSTAKRLIRATQK